MKKNIQISLLSVTLFLTGWTSAQTQQFTTTGSNSFTVPTGVVSLKVECVGAGGGGGRVTPSSVFDSDAAGGGGGGAYASSIVDVVEGNVYDITVGAGGFNTGTSADGGNSYFATGNEVSAEGGKTRSGNDQESGALGGKALNSIGAIVYNGGNGGDGDEGDTNGGGGGGAAGSGGIGHNGAEVTAGLNQSMYGGQGGQGGPDGANGASGANYGGGGGGSSANGSSDRNGGNGANGIVVVSWSQVDSFSPTTVCATGNATVQVLGLNFTGVDSVVINGQSIPFNFVSNSELTILVSSSTPSGLIYVYTPSGASKSAVGLEVVQQSVNPTVNGTTISANYTGNGNETYQWLDCINGNSIINGETSSTFTSGINGLFAVVVTENGCSITSSCAIINTASISDNNINEFKLFPNPTAGLFTVEFENLDYQTLQVYTVEGKRVLIREVDSSIITIDISKEIEGLYFVHFIGEHETRIEYVVKGNR